MEYRQPKWRTIVEVRGKQKIDYFAGYALIGLLVPVTRLLGITLRRDHVLKAPPRRILFIKLLGLGSLILASDAITAMRARYPDTRFILLTDSNIAAGIAPFQLFDEIRVVNTNKLFFTALDVLRVLVRSWQWRRLWVIDLEVYSKLTTVFALMTLARNRFGFHLAPVLFRKYLNTHNIPFDQEAHLEDNYGRMARTVTGHDLPMLIPPSRPGHGEKPYIILNNTCSGLADVRRLPDSTFSELCQWVLDNTGYGLALLGAPADKADIDRLIDSTPGLSTRRNRIINFAGKATDFTAYYGFLREQGVCLVTIDSGPLHIARKLGLPTLSVWGPTNPDNYLKIADEERHRHLFYYAQTPCSPCIHRYDPLPCGGNNFCMKNIPSAAIIEKLRELLQQVTSWPAGYKSHFPGGHPTDK